MADPKMLETLMMFRDIEEIPKNSLDSDTWGRLELFRQIRAIDASGDGFDYVWEKYCPGYNLDKVQKWYRLPFGSEVIKQIEEIRRRLILLNYPIWVGVNRNRAKDGYPYYFWAELNSLAVFSTETVASTICPEPFTPHKLNTEAELFEAINSLRDVNNLHFPGSS